MNKKISKLIDMVRDTVSKYTGIYYLNLNFKCNYNCQNQKVDFSIIITFTNDECIVDDFISQCKFEVIQDDIDSKWKKSSNDYPEKDSCQVEYYKTTDNSKFVIMIKSL